MKRLLTALAVAGLLLLPTTSLAQTQTGGTEPSPISQTLVREGDFAVDLAYVMKLGEPATEAEAEDALTAVGIAPDNGWIADYPVTPDILAELENSVEESVFAGKITLGKEEALKAFRGLALEYGLPVRKADEQEYAEDNGELEYGDYSSERVGEGEDYYEPTVIEEYYYVNEPPVITYYSPPWDYYYLYSWVPYPFWWYGFYYPGYFILNDFHVSVHHHHHRHHKWHKDRDWGTIDGSKKLVSNHVKDKRTGDVTRLDPATRKAVRAERRERKSIDRQKAWTSFKDVKSAESIVKRDMTRQERRAERRALTNDKRVERRALTNDKRVERRAVTTDRNAARQAVKTERRAVRDARSVERPTRLGDVSATRAERRAIRSENRAARTFERATRLGDRNRSLGNDRASSGSRSADRSFSAPSRGGGNRSFGAPSRGGGNRSFSRPSRGGGGFKGGGSRGCWGGKC